MFKTYMRLAVFSVLFFSLSEAFAHNHTKLGAILDARSEEAKQRDIYRHPRETLELFGIKPGMTVIDALPGSWYGDIIAPLIGEQGTYIGIRYGEWYYKNRFGDDYAEKWEDAQTALEDWPEQAEQYGGGENGPDTEAYFFPGLPVHLDEQVDAVLLFRALHHTNKYGSSYFDMTAADAFRVLKSGGIVGVVQHRAPEDSDDTWANGSNGYLKQSLVIETFRAAGFELENASEVNANRKDQPTAEDKVWRLLPSNKNDPTAKEIGESDRMTLVFRKP